MVIPLAEILSRRFLSATVLGSGPLASNLTLWLGMLGAAIAARDGKLLALATGEFLPEGRVRAVARVASAAIAALVATILALASMVLVGSDREAGSRVALGIPVWVADL